MTRKSPPKAKKLFEKGQSGNPSGKAKVPNDIKEVRKVSQFELERAINRLIWLPLEQLRVVIKDPKTPILEIMLATIMAQCAQKGDQQRLEFLLNRMIGKVKDIIDVKHSEPFIIQRGNGQQVVLGFSEGAGDDSSIEDDLGARGSDAGRAEPV